MNLASKYLIGNWKMHFSIDEAQAYFHSLYQTLQTKTFRTQLGLGINLLHVSAALNTLDSKQVMICAQDAFPIDAGAYTGATSAAQLKASNVHYALVGHSERRQQFGDDLEMVAQKVQACLRHHIAPILCVGESLKEYESNLRNDVLGLQLKSALHNVSADQVKTMIIAYEPVWAIGTGQTASAAVAQATIAYMRHHILTDLYGATIAQQIPILYGGSVNDGNIAELLNQPDINGALVGGASLKVADFIKLAELLQ